LRVTRSEFLRFGVGASTGWLLTGTRGRAQDADQAARVARLIEQYDSQGIHRTATEVDDRAARWLADRVRRPGVAVSLESFDLQRVDPGESYVEAEGRRAEGLPFFDGAFTDERGIRGRIAPPEYHHPIALVVLDSAGISSEGRSLEALRRAGKHQAIVAVTNGAHEGLSPSNADAFTRPYGVPVLQVATDDHLFLRDLTARGAEVRLVAHAVRRPASASNVVVTVPGKDPALPPLVVMTPRSGWWHCASERGGGIACWTEAIRAVAEARTARTLMAVASSGHELGHLGLDMFLEKRRHLVKEAVAWIHLGANIGAAGGVPRLQASDDRLEALANEALSRAGAEVRQRVPRGSRPGGEARNIYDGGGRYVSLLGSGPFFHNMADRWPAAVDVHAVTRFCRSFGDLAVTLANSLKG
jgi:hypothetical protein